ncbi:M16 family metallopeptidase [Aquabacterium sp.]|uniref:M16 family metallopeptidase n=1 Tax=Aquabacterium sp. TaxID=1872578 RepID=UPI002C0806B7|nr:pitrilysin family protein [Aquabacterium sp.]HSW07251.1 pitrilysin family protein [Aquabacterium sp.]
MHAAPALTAPAPEAGTAVHTLPNGVRIVTIVQPWLDSVSISVFVRAGSQHESRRLNGISHVVEHMAFKGTASRDCQRINLDAERLGAEVNAHTDKDHTAFHMNGLAQHAGALLRMLGDIVRNSSFPQSELERERQVILQEYIEDEDDPMSTAYKLFDHACYGTHPVAQAVIGTRANIERFTRDELLGHVQRLYSGANVIVGVAGRIAPAAIVDEAQAAFGSMPAGSENSLAPPAWIGGSKTRRHAGSSQSHLVLGFPIPPLTGDYHASLLATALFGEGMSSPLMDSLRERRGLVYHASCSADVMAQHGQFVLEASTSPGQLDELFTELAVLLRQQAAAIDPVGLERARNQIAVRSLRSQQQPFRCVEDAAQDLFVHGRVCSRAELLARIQAVTADEVQQAFGRMLAAPPALAIVGKLAKGADERFLAQLAEH